MTKTNCELCGASVRVVGNTTKHYENLDQVEIKKLKASEINLGKCLITECCGHLYPQFVLKKSLKDRDECEDYNEYMNQFDDDQEGALKGLEGEVYEIILREIKK